MAPPLLYTNKLVAGVGMVAASVSELNATRGMSTPLLVKLTSSPADTLGEAPVALMPKFCDSARFTEQELIIASNNMNFLII